jgi:hypothetical protein
VVLLISCHAAIGQAKPGIYLTISQDLELCDHKMKLLNAETVYCISEEPIIELDSFEKVTDMAYDSLFEMRKFRIILTPKGAKYVNTIAAKLPDHKLALVVNGILVSTIDLEGIYSVRTIVIWDQFDSQSMVWIHRSLVNSVTKFHKKS